MNNTIKIPFKGITRNTDDQMSSDGECMELINARIANGSVEPVNNPILIKTLGEAYKKIYYHQKADRYIALKSDKTIVCITSDLSTVTALSTDLIGVIEISFIGLIACVLTESGIKYMRWKAGNYLYLGEIPELPEIRIGVECTVKEEKTDTGVSVSSNDAASFDKRNELLYAYWLKAMNSLNKKGYFLHTTCIRIAFRLMDGSYVKHSPIRLIAPTGSYNNNSLASGVNEWIFGTFATENKYSSTESDKYYCSSLGFKPTFSANNISYNLSSWKDIILSIDIFASKSMRPSFNGTNGTFEKDEQPDLLEVVSNQSNFYKIASFDLEGNLTYKEQDVSPSILVLNDELSDDNLTHNNLYADKAYMYNSRLHMFNISNDIFNGYGIDVLKDYITIQTNGNPNAISTIEGSMDIYYYVNTSHGTAITKKSWGQGTSIPTTLSPYLMYPDSRAYRMIIRITKDNGTILTKTFNLLKHSTLNISYCMESDYDRTIETWDTTDITIYENEIIEPDNTKLKVSALNNPFYFPPRTTYQMSSDIIAIQSNAVALSQGQFGQYPLYVFCKDGIYAMQVGTDVVYSNSVPVSRDICTNPNVCGIDTSVLFATDRGLMSINGTQVECISEPLNGYLPSCFNSSPVLSKILKIANLDDRVSTLIFNDYLKGANIGYNYADSEIIVSNNTCTYSYIFNLKSGQWHKISHKIDSFINAYPNTLIVEGETIYNPFNPHRSISKIALVTRPIKLGSTTHKRLFQVALRSIIKRALSDLYLRGEPVQYRGEDLTIFSDIGFYILGSEDGEHFSFLVGRESLKDIRDLVTKANKTKACKSFIVCLVGGVRSDVSINYLEMIAEEAFGNRLR